MEEFPDIGDCSIPQREKRSKSLPNRTMVVKRKSQRNKSHDILNYSGIKSGEKDELVILTDLVRNSSSQSAKDLPQSPKSFIESPTESKYEFGKGSVKDLQNLNISLEDLQATKDIEFKKYAMTVGSVKTVEFLYEYYGHEKFTFKDVEYIYKKYISDELNECICLKHLTLFNLKETLRHKKEDNADAVGKLLYEEIVFDAKLNLVITFERRKNATHPIHTVCVFRTVNNEMFRTIFFSNLFMINPECRRFFYNERIMNHFIKKFSILLRRRFTGSKMNRKYIKKVIRTHANLKIPYSFFIGHKTAFLLTCREITGFDPRIIEQIHDAYNELILLVTNQKTLRRKSVVKPPKMCLIM